MLPQKNILNNIALKVHSVLPDANVMLYGSRARGDWHEESDWDILILTSQEVNRSVKDAVWDAVYPVSLEIASFVSPFIVQKDAWENYPGYYSLKKSIAHELVAM
jgi:predicted nucleotidyltransferase